MTDRIKQVLEAFALGDAAGMPTQLLSHSRALELISQDGPFGAAPDDHEICPGLPGGTITDDTHQLLILADNLISFQGLFDQASFASELLAWEARMAASGSSDLLGPSTKAALLALAQSSNPSEVSFAGTTNGGAMRVAAIACAVPILSVAGAESMIRQVVEVNRLSHNSPAANIGCIAVSSMISAGLDGIDYGMSIDVVKNAAMFMTEHLGASQDENYIGERLDDILFEVDHAHAVGGDEQALDYIVREVGTSLESRESVLAAFAVAHLAQNSPMRAAVNGARLGGDSDTIAAMAAAMVAAFGVWEAPEQMAWAKVARVNDLDFSSRATELARLRENYRDDI